MRQAVLGRPSSRAGPGISEYLCQEVAAEAPNQAPDDHHWHNQATGYGSSGCDCSEDEVEGKEGKHGLCRQHVRGASSEEVLDCDPARHEGQSSHGSVSRDAGVARGFFAAKGRPELSVQLEGCMRLDETVDLSVVEGIDVVKAAAVKVALTLRNPRREFESQLLQIARSFLGVIENCSWTSVGIVLHSKETRRWNHLGVLLKVLPSLKDLVRPLRSYALIAVRKSPLNRAIATGRYSRYQGADGA